MSNLIKLERVSTQLDVERARDLLAKCVHVDEAQGMRNQAQAAEVMARKLKLGREAEQLAAEVALWAERRLGELLASMPKHEGTKGQLAGGTKQVPPGKDAPKLTDIGVSKKESARAQKLAAVPAKTIERRVEALKSGGKHITVSKVLSPPAVPVEQARSVWRAAESLRDLRRVVDRALDDWPATEGTTRLVAELRLLAARIESDQPKGRGKREYDD